jgi:hypothetical protein
MSLITRLLVVSILSASLLAQHGHRDPSPEDRDANPDRAVVAPAADPVQAARDSEEMLALSQSVYTDLRHASATTVSKDLRERLKRVEKLSKKLRSELLLD